MKRIIIRISLILCCGILAVMLYPTEWREPKDTITSAPEIFPDYRGVTVPRGIAPLNFAIKDARHIQVEVRCCTSGRTMTASGKDHIEMDIEEWHRLIQAADSLEFNVSAWTDRHPDGVRYNGFKMYVSPDAIDPWIMYRLIPPGYEGWNKMGIYQRDLSTFEERVIADNTDNGRGCLNCHAACNANPDNFMFHSRGENGGTVIKHDGKLYKINLKALEPGLQGSYNAWHPNARYIAFSSNTTVQSFMARSRDKIEGYDLRGDIIIYDIEKDIVHWDERFTNDSTQESFPTFSPDGKWLYFVSAKPVNMPTEYDRLRYDILRVPFDMTTAKLGAVDTVFSSHNMQRSAIIPRISPDGRYLMYSTSPTGALNLYHNDSDLEMIDLTMGNVIDCAILNSNQSESYHNWSTNGKWIIFSSKRVDGRFTRTFIAHWD
ncbi:MAG: PD40 domain-containing protein, partial [Bacteroidaceae bacterium]|nr:PD40 domain-containing protein [Bacteroidaceae bacterium]